jgi:hypothetical protein
MVTGEGKTETNAEGRGRTEDEGDSGWVLSSNTKRL